MLRAAAVCVLALVWVFAGPQARAASEKIVYSFGSQPHDGISPSGTLTAVLGNLYGTTRHGGAANDICPGDSCGTVFKVTPEGDETVVLSFPHAQQENANGGLVFVLGKLFGTSYGFGYGSLIWSLSSDAYSVTLDGAFTDLNNFNSSGVSNPDSGLIDVDGLLYGVTFSGGECAPYYQNCGAVYRLTQTGKLKILHYFNTTDPDGGTEPSGALLFANGMLYGTTEIGGGSEPNCPLAANTVSRCGVVFGVTLAGAEKTIYIFKGQPDGAGPVGNLVSLNGNPWGMTSGGGARNCGTVFEVTPRGKERVVYSFGAAPDGCQPTGGLLDVGGVYYGTTYYGGAYGKGTVFSVTSGGKEKVIYSFGGYKLDGANPQGNLTLLGGFLYGTTPTGGVHGSGTVFRIDLGK